MPKVLVIGDVIDDILVRPVGLIRNDTDTTSEITSAPGGSGANFACWLASLGVETHFVGRVGQADLERHSESLAAFGVIPHLQSDSIHQTGKIVVLVEGQTRSFLTDRGANKYLDLNQIDLEWFGDALYISGYSVLDQAAKDLKSLFERARPGLVVCDPGSAGYIADHSVLEFLNRLEGVDLVTPSLEEGRILTAESAPSVIAGLLARRFPMVALTLGSVGVQLSQGEETELVEAIPADIVDATGAGDAFAAKLLEQILGGNSLSTSAQAAVRFAAKAVTVVGGRPTSN
ncbi:carbohydrate kinase family protein [Aquiluna borgnonia]|uniref:Carbohydrate kinase family protein n=1 Tax=Aquiluna borgnonia TaxID=2499157 RepID=A0A7D4PWM0_9MICO|nr:carbohydrate kinase family protein [Aquiluna borgnonia]QKJ24724.1 carbohydrate kinase family protein [Aquiluna borgnonia]